MKSAVVYGLVTPDGTGYQEVPLGTSPQARSLQLKVLPKKAVSLPPRRSALVGNSLLQQRIRDWNSPLSFGYSYRNLGGTAAPFTAYTPEHYYEPGHGGILPPLEPLSPGHHQLDYTWTVPSVPGATGLFANVVYIGESQRQLISQGIPQAIVNSNQIHFTIVHDISSDGSNTGTTVATVDGTELYNGPARVLWPWVTGYASGQYNLRMTVDGDVRVDEDYIQQALIFEQPFPQSTVDNPGDTTITNRFGWSIDDTNIDDSLQLDNPSWSAGLTTGALHDAPRHLGNQVSFTINALKETLTKHIQPLTNVPLNLGPVAKETQPNKTLPYYVYAHADAVTDYRLDSAGSLPGYRAMVQVSNFRQTPSPAILGQPTTFSFDVTPINFDTAEMDFSLGLGASADGGQYSWSTTEGNPTKTSNGWHVEVPWTTTTLPSLAGMLEVNCHDTVLPQRYASQQVPFTVSLENQKKLTIDNANPTPVQFNPTQGGTALIEYDVNWTGQGNPPQIYTQVEILSADGSLFHTFAIQSFRDQASVHVTVPSAGGWDGRNQNGALISGNFKWVIKANTVPEVAGGVGVPEEAEPAIRDGVAQNSAPNPYPSLLTVSREFEKLATTIDGQLDSQLVNTVFEPTVSSSTTQTWVIHYKFPPFSSDQPQEPRPDNIEYSISITSGEQFRRTLKWDQATESYKDSLAVGNLTSSLVDSETYSFAQTKRPKAEISAAVQFRKILFEAVDPQQRFSLGGFFEDLHFPGTNLTEQEAVRQRWESPREVKLTLANFLKYGFIGYTIQIEDARIPASKRSKAVIKMGRGPKTLILNLHGRHVDGAFLLTPFAAKAGLVRNETWESDGLSLPFQIAPSIRRVFSLSCSTFDLRDYNNFYSNAHYPFDLGHDPNEKIGGLRNGYGGDYWYSLFEKYVGPGNFVLLGYNGPAPGAGSAEAAPLFQAYRNQLPEPLAWLKANKEVAERSDNPGQDLSVFVNWLCLNACAYDKDGYYYLAYKTPDGSYQSKSGEEQPPPIVPGTVRAIGAYFIPKDRWRMEALRWKDIPQLKSETETIGLNITEKIK